MSVFGCKALGRGTDAGAGVPLSGAGRVSGVSRARGAAPWTERSDAKTAGCFIWQSAVPPRRAHEYMAVRLCIEVRHSYRMVFQFLCLTIFNMDTAALSHNLFESGVTFHRQIGYNTHLHK